mgnify:CR=1 FL=1
MSQPLSAGLYCSDRALSPNRERVYCLQRALSMLLLLGLAASVLQAASLISFCGSVRPTDDNFECLLFRGGGPVILVRFVAPVRI